jgi:hypothetical protein
MRERVKERDGVNDREREQAQREECEADSRSVSHICEIRDRGTLKRDRERDGESDSQTEQHGGR